MLLAQGRDVEWFRQRMQGQEEPTTSKKIRASLVVATPEGILLAKDHKGFWLLPGGGLQRGEIPICAAARDLYEETNLTAQSIRFLFEYESEHYIHHVFEVTQYAGHAIAQDDAKALGYCSEKDIVQERLSPKLLFANKEILKKYIAR